tara:strand:- start:416 stop:562 length:147 start_codon:yes stop_codon:yes gene_type:complete
MTLTLFLYIFALSIVMSIIILGAQYLDYKIWEFKQRRLEKKRKKNDTE